MISAELQRLIEQYLDEMISEEDFRRLWDTLPHEENDAVWLAAIENAIVNKTRLGLADPERAMLALQSIKAQISGEAMLAAVPKNRISRFYIDNARFLRIAAAVLLVAGAAAFMLTSGKPDKSTAVTTVKVVPHNDVLPGTKIAKLTLSDGSTIELDNVGNGRIAQQGSVQVIKLANGELQYKTAGKVADRNVHIGYNTMATPRGGQYELQLPDGSRVWLNAESSITYPVVFTGSERRVKIVGEAYFEIAKDKNKPFRVEADDINIEVLGTHFNVNAYRGEDPVKTTLLEGSVKINTQVLKPGQAYVNGKVVPTNVDQDVAWKNGVFNFNDQNLSQIMMQLSRWYDLEVVFPRGVPKKQYAGEIGRNLNLSQVLKGLENSGVHFQLQGRQLIVKP